MVTSSRVQVHWNFTLDVISRDPDGMLCFGPIKYIQKILNVFENMFKEKPRPSSSPLEKNDHPESDDLEEVDAEMITQYQSMIGVGDFPGEV